MSFGTTVVVAALAIADAGQAGDFGAILDSVVPGRAIEVPVVASDVQSLVGRWRGEANQPGGPKFEVKVEVLPDCSMNGPCGWIAVTRVPCRGRLTLIDSRPEGFEFHVDRFGEGSDESLCQPSAGEVLQARPDGTLSYTATYSGARGLLTRTD